MKCQTLKFFIAKKATDMVNTLHITYNILSVRKGVDGFASITFEGFSGNVVIKKITRSLVESKQVKWDVETPSESTTSGGLNDYADGKSETRLSLTADSAASGRESLKDVQPADQSNYSPFDSTISPENEKSNKKTIFSEKRQTSQPDTRRWHNPRRVAETAG